MKTCLSRAAFNLTPMVLAGLALSGLTGCVQEPPLFDAHAAQAWELKHDNEVKLKPLYPLPTTSESPETTGDQTEVDAARRREMAVPEGPAVHMSLQEVVHRAIVNNMEIRVASYDTAIDQTRVLEAEGNFDPKVFWDANEQRIDKFTPGVQGNTLAANGTLSTKVVDFDKEQLFTSDIGIRQNLLAGGKAEIKQEINNVWSNPRRGILQSFYQNDLVVSLTQPLLQNFGVEVNRARIVIAQNNQRISLLDFRKTLEETVLKIEQTYWQLVQTERDIDTLRREIKSSVELKDRLSRRAGNDVTNAQLQAVTARNAQREVTLIQLQNQVSRLSRGLKQLMNDPAYPVSSAAIITPTDEGTEVAMHFNRDDQLETAMENRYELGQQQVRIDSAEIAVAVAKNNRLPSLNAQLEATVDGLGSNIGRAFSREGDFSHLGYQAGLQFEFPLGNRAAAAIWQRSLLQRMQAISSYAGLVNQIALDVANAADDVDYAWARLSRARASRLAYENLLSILKTQDESGNVAVTFDSVEIRLNNQEQLAGAEQAEHQALNDYNFAIASLEKAKGTLLRYNNVVMEQEMLPFDMSMKGAAISDTVLMGAPR